MHLLRKSSLSSFRDNNRLTESRYLNESSVQLAVQQLNGQLLHGFHVAVCDCREIALKKYGQPRHVYIDVSFVVTQS
jgi:hypothetical protein